MSKKNKLSVVIIAKNEEEKIGDALRSVDWANEIIVIDTGSTDKTVNIAKSNNAKIIQFTMGSYDAWRNKGLEQAEGDWLLYIDADERVSPLLRNEIKSIIQTNDTDISAYAIPRKNFIFKKEFKFGGETPDHQIRLFYKKRLLNWRGEVHEKPEFKGKLSYAKHSLIHLKHDNIKDMVTKTNRWSEIEADLLFKNGHPKMVSWRFIRIMLTEFFDRIIKKQGLRDGKEGVIYSLYQVWSKCITYVKLWEMQLNATNNTQKAKR